ITHKVCNDLFIKANKWAEETAAEMRASAPVDTGNLLESIHVLKDECVIDRGKGEITMVVGADLDPAGGHGRLYAPPMRKRSPKYGRKNPPWKGYRLMPVPDNEYASKFLGDVSVEEKFKNISKKNAKKIMGK
ncbi:HK97 gp10 family phage protein, partial [Candidatus Saccharibacteria bacterium]|nr:HK97 gp10 family phage protein [Candidatus Saccharibacteria bacterium]